MWSEHRGRRSRLSGKSLARHKMNIVPPRSVATYRSEHYTYRSLWSAAERLRELGETDDANGFWSLLAATLLAFTAFEGFVNEAIESAAPDTWKRERKFFASGKYTGTMGKAAFLADHAGHAVLRDARPFQTVAELCAWRNELVHPRTARIQGEALVVALSNKPRHAKPTVFKKLERPEFVERCFADIVALADLLLDGFREKEPNPVRHLGRYALWGPVGTGKISLKQ